MSSEIKPKSTVQVNSSTAGVFWIAGWMFTIAFAKLIWWKAVLALIVWPWYLALAIR